jgi:outer membrane protein assembly factor BamB
LAGVAVSGRYVIVPGRDARNTSDVFRCLDADTGSELWRKSYLAPGELDFGNSPRATPLIDKDRAFLSGALGRFTCVELSSGKVLWQKEFRKDFGLRGDLPWGFCSSPVLHGENVIINPGGPDASIVALDAATGAIRWQAAGNPPGHGSFIVGQIGLRAQIIGYDHKSLGGWDSQSGERLWGITPPVGGDFNVPTPILWNDQLVVATENNGTRVYAFSAEGILQPEPVATHHDLNPDTQTPVVVGGRLFGVASGLHCLDLKNSLATLWRSEHDAFSKHASLIASPDRVLVISQEGDLILLDATAAQFSPLSMQKVFRDDAGVYSHPALVGSRLYLRGSQEIVCVSLDAAAN